MFLGNVYSPNVGAKYYVMFLCAQKSYKSAVLSFLNFLFILAWSRLLVVGEEKKKKVSERNNKGGLKRGREGKEPVRTSLTTVFHPPLVQ